jgi:hypothetical protein
LVVDRESHQNEKKKTKQKKNIVIWMNNWKLKKEVDVNITCVLLILNFSIFNPSER